MYVSIDIWIDYVLDYFDGGNKSVCGVCGLEKYGEFVLIVIFCLYLMFFLGIEFIIVFNMLFVFLKIGKMYCVWRFKIVCLLLLVVS